MLKSSYMNDRWQNRCRGAVMVEFAIVAPLLLLLVFGITELGRSLFQENILTQAVQTGARYMARVPGILDDECSPINTGNEWSTAEGVAKNLVVYGKQAPASGDTPVIANLATNKVVISPSDDPVVITVTVEGDTYSGQPACIISVSATNIQFEGIFGSIYTTPPIPFVGGPDTGGIGLLQLNADTQERYIGE